MQQPPNNPYANAAGTYDQIAKDNTGNQREIEARILLKSNRMLQDLYNDWDNASKFDEVIEETLRYNRNIWMVFYDSSLENQDDDKPDELRSNIINLANFVFKRSLEIMSNKDCDKEKIKVLININSNIAAGLMENVAMSKKIDNSESVSRDKKPMTSFTA